MDMGIHGKRRETKCLCHYHRSCFMTHARKDAGQKYSALHFDDGGSGVWIDHEWPELFWVHTGSDDVIDLRYHFSHILGFSAS